MKKIFAVLLCLAVALMMSARVPVFQRITTADGLSNNQVQYIHQLADGRMLIVAWRSANIYDGASVTVFPRQDECAVSLPHWRGGYSVAADSAGRVWVKEFGRVWCLDLQRHEMRRDIADMLGGQDVLDVFHTNAGIVLLTLRGLVVKDSGRILPLPCAADELWCVEAEGGRLLLFCADGGIVAIDGADGRVLYRVPCADIPPLSRIHDMSVLRCADGSYCRRLYAERYTRIDRFDTAAHTWAPVMETQMVLYDMMQPDAGHLTVGCRHGLFVLKTGGTATLLDSIEAAPLPQGVTVHGPATFHTTFATEGGGQLHDISVHGLCTDRRGGMWMALGDCGVLYTHALRHSFASASDAKSLGVPDSVVWQCHIRLSRLFRFNEQRDNDELTDRYGRYWRATHNGVTVATDTETMHIGRADGLPGDFVQSIAEDSRGRVWLGTNRGICCVECVSPLRIACYGVHDGVPQWDAMASSAAVLSDGRIAMQFEQGWVAFHPDSVARPAYRLTPVLTSATAGGQQHTGEWLLDYTDNDIALTFTTDNYAFPHSVCYRWRIAGAGDWRTAGADDVHDGQLRLGFMHLAPGTYTVEVQAAAGGGAFDGGTCMFGFTIRPPWWQTWWARALYALCAMAVAGVIAGQYIRRKQDRLKQQMREEALLRQIETLIKAAQAPPQRSLQGEGEGLSVLPDDIVGEDTTEISKEESAPDKTDQKSLPASPSPAAHDDFAVVESWGEAEGESGAFLQRAVALVHQHLADNYTVEQMAADLCMERTGLYKRLTALVNQSPQLFIRSIRLRRAVEMMQRGASVTDAAYAAGFNSVSYFGRCFAREFGCPPSEYLRRQGEV